VTSRISRLEQAQDAAPLAPAAVAPVRSDLVETFAFLAEDKDQTLILDPVPEELSVMGDGPMLSQLLANLAASAASRFACAAVTSAPEAPAASTREATRPLCSPREARGALTFGKSVRCSSASTSLAARSLTPSGKRFPGDTDNVCDSSAIP
jgi:hypothetical protein